jgi:glycosyltransferase involved in cell wall biosynthesis
LEGIASGCFPVAGDLESIREWIEPGKNGLLVDPTDPDALAHAIVEAFMRKDLRVRAAGLNEKRIREKAEYFTCMAQAKSFYERVLARRN